MDIHGIQVKSVKPVFLFPKIYLLNCEECYVYTYDFAVAKWFSYFIHVDSLFCYLIINLNPDMIRNETTRFFFFFNNCTLNTGKEYCK